jgi:hypothetical protein
VRLTYSSVKAVRAAWKVHEKGLAPERATGGVVSANKRFLPVVKRSNSKNGPKLMRVFLFMTFAGVAVRIHLRAARRPSTTEE